MIRAKIEQLLQPHVRPEEVRRLVRGRFGFLLSPRLREDTEQEIQVAVLTCPNVEAVKRHFSQVARDNGYRRNGHGRWVAREIPTGEPNLYARA